MVARSLTQSYATRVLLQDPMPDLDALDEDDLVELASMIGVPESAAEDIKTSIRKRYAAYSLDDTNFHAPHVNPKVREPAMCEPEIYEVRDESAEGTARMS